jgi:hypothetical protein
MAAAKGVVSAINAHVAIIERRPTTRWRPGPVRNTTVDAK